MIRLFEKGMCTREVFSGIQADESAEIRKLFEQEEIRYRRKILKRGREKICVRPSDEARARRLIQLKMNEMWRDSMRNKM